MHGQVGVVGGAGLGHGLQVLSRVDRCRKMVSCVRITFYRDHESVAVDLASILLDGSRKASVIG